MKTEDLAVWESFLAVATHGSFSEAARKLHVPLSQVSKRVSRLETQLGVRLFQRTTRVVTLTDEGRALGPKVHAIFEDLKEAESLFEGDRELTGTIRVTAVPFVAHRLLIPVLAEFRAQHPQVQFDMDLSEKLVNLVESGFDLAIRIETPKPTDLVYRRLAPNDLVFCASPKYLAKSPKLTAPKDLRHHNVLALDVHHSVRFQKSSLRLGEVIGTKRLRSDNGAFLTALAEDSQGVLVRSIWDIQPQLKAGTLVQVLKKHPLETFGHIHAVVPTRRFLAPRVRAFLDFLEAKAKTWKK